MVKIKRDYRKLVDELLKINHSFIADIILTLYNIPALRKDFGQFFQAEINHENYVQVISTIVNVIERRQKENLQAFLDPIINRNKKYVEFYGDMNKIDLETLKKIFAENKAPSIHDEGLTPEMMILYYFSRNMFNHDWIPELIREYKYYFQLSEKARQQHQDFFKSIPDGRLPDITELERHLFETEDICHLDKVDWHEVARNFGCEYDETTRKFNGVKRGLLLFYDVNIKLLKEAKYHYDSTVSVLESSERKILLSAERLNRVWKYCHGVAEENRKLYSQIKTLRRQLSELSVRYKSISKAPEQSKEKQLTELLKENYYLKTRIEKLEQEIQRLREAQEINKEITESIFIPETEIEPQKVEEPALPEYQTIVVVGGMWNSRSKEELQQRLSTCDIRFVEAEKTIARIDTIASADIVIFDTSRNAHKYFYIVKEHTRRLYLINKSDAERVIELFSCGWSK